MSQLRSIMESVIGQPRRDGEGWLEYNCPYCAAELGVESDGKYNLALNYGDVPHTKAYFHCWKCETSGKLSRLIKDFGSADTLRLFLSEIKANYEVGLFNINTNGNETSDAPVIELPEGVRKITEQDSYSWEALDYLRKRGITDHDIEKFNIMFVPYWVQDKNMASRIIIPSYDEYGDLNYYVARDYTGYRKHRKYNNPLLKKTKFIFNEDKVNWYDDVTLVEGAFDHIAVPNSIPLLGKSLKPDYAVFDCIIENAKENINVFLDDDAFDDAKKIYKLLNNTKLHGRVRIIECPKGYDAADIYKKYGTFGIVAVLRIARQLEDYELVFD